MSTDFVRADELNKLYSSLFVVKRPRNSLLNTNKSKADSAATEGGGVMPPRSDFPSSYRLWGSKYKALYEEAKMGLCSELLDSIKAVADLSVSVSESQVDNIRQARQIEGFRKDIG